jgi:hypothetical protein
MMVVSSCAKTLESTHDARQLMREESTAAPPSAANPVRNIRRICERCEIDEFEEFCTTMPTIEKVPIFERALFAAADPPRHCRHKTMRT